MTKFVKNLLTVASLCAVGLMANTGHAQLYYGVNPWYYGGVYPYGYTYSGPVGSTVYSTNAQAYSSLLRNQAEYNQASAQAMLQYQQARGAYIENQKALLDLYQQRADLAQQYQPIRSEVDTAADREAARERRQQFREANQPRSTGFLTSSEYDSATGELIFPDALKGPAFDEGRTALQSLFGMRAAFGSTPERDRQIVETTQRMLSLLKSKIGELPAGDYLAARAFLEHARNVALASSSP